MKRLGIQTFNITGILFLLVALPAAMRMEVGSWELRSTDQVHQLIFWGALTISLLDAILAKWAVRKRPLKLLCWKWAGAFAALALLEGMIWLDWIHFDWLRDWLKAGAGVLGG